MEKRDHPIEPFTTSITMNHGWCWNIEIQDRITRGYVHSSQFCSEEEAIEELKAMTPQIKGDIRIINFPSGRLERHWVNNVVAVGNSSGFVEPIEATALHVVTEQLHYITALLQDSSGPPAAIVREKECERMCTVWDDIRDFIVAHYKFNRHSDTPFWKHCRSESSLGNATEFCKYYQEAGPMYLSKQSLFCPLGIFGFNGYMNILLGQKVETKRPPPMTKNDWKD